MSNSLTAEKVWVVRQVVDKFGNNLRPDKYIAKLHRIIDFGYFGEPIWIHEPIEEYFIDSAIELEKFIELSVDPFTIIYS